MKQDTGESEQVEAKNNGPEPKESLLRRVAKIIGLFFQNLLKIPGFSVTKTRQIFYLLVKYSFYSSLCLLFTLSVGYSIARLYFTDSKISEILEDLVANETGGHMEIGNFQMDLLKGIIFNDITFYPNKSAITDDRHHKHLFKLKRIEITYSFLKLLTGRLHISAVKFIHPELYIRKDNDEFNFNSITKYRSEKYPSSKENQQENRKDNGSSSSPTDLAVLKSLLIYMPIEIIIHGIGISNLQVDFDTFSEGNLNQQIHLSGASVDIGAYWHKSKSNFWISFISSFDNPLVFTLADIRKKPGNNEVEKSKLPKSQHTNSLEPSVIVKSAQIIRAEIVDLTTLKLDIAMRLPNLKLDEVTYQDASIYSRGRVKFSNDLKKISIEEFDHQILDAVLYNLHGDLTLSSDSFEKIFLQCDQSLKVDLDKITELIRPFSRAISLHGKIRLEKIAINGELNLTKSPNFAQAEGLPSMSGIVWLENITADVENSGLDMLPVSGKISLNSSPKPSQDGIQSDLSMDLSVPRVTLKKNFPTVGDLDARIDNLNLKLISRLTWPDAIIPILNLDLEIERLSAASSISSSFEAPVSLNINAEGDRNLRDVSLNQLFQIGSLAELSLTGSCQDSCSRFRANILARLESLKKIHAIAMPMKGTIIPAEFMPDQLEGNVDLQFNTRGEIPNPLTTDIAEILKSGEVRFNLQSTISKLNSKLPFMNTSLMSLDNRIIINGDLKEQNFEISQKFNSLSIKPKNSELSTNKASYPSLRMDQYSFDLQVKNTLNGPIDLGKPFNNMSTEVLTWFYLGKLDAPAIIPKPLSELSFETELSQSGLNQVSAKNILIRLPDYGLTTKLSADSILDESYLPLKISTSLTNKIVHKGTENLPGGLKTVGQLETIIKINSEDMVDYNIDGQFNFEKFSFYIFNPKNPEQKTLSIEEVTGEIPLKQRVRLPDFHTLLSHQKDGGTGVIPKSQSEGSSENQETQTIQNIAKKTISSEVLKGNLTETIEQYLSKTEDKLKDKTNVMSIVDYNTIRPFFPNKRPLSIQRIDVANLELTNLEFDVELKQNWFALNQYIVSFLGGKIQGAFLLSFDASLGSFFNLAADLKKIPKMVRASIHLTRLDTRRLLERFPNLKGKGESLIQAFSNPYLDGTVHVSFDMLTNELGGGVEITSIGKEQLKMMLYYIDPFEQNATIADIRGALNLGEIRQVSIPFKNGEIGLEVDVRLIGAPIPTPKLSRFPISQIITNFVSQSASSGPSENKKDIPQKTSAYLDRRRFQGQWYALNHYISRS